MIEEALERAWGIIADQGAVDVVLRFGAGRRRASRRDDLASRPRSRPRESDGSLMWRATVSGTVEIRAWILSWGPDVEVVAPEPLRAEVAGLLEAAAAGYR